MTKSQFLVEGMSCGHCVKSVTSALLAVEGVKKAQVDLDSHSASVEYDETCATLDDLFEAVRDQGYSPKKKA